MSPANPARPITTHDVARRAGVSQATVSLVLGGNPRARVAQATRERVMHAAAELGYRPNMAARSLVRGRSYALGVVVPDLSNPFFLDVVTGAQRVAAEAGYAVLPGDTRETTPARHLEALRARQVDGVIIDGLG
ncbi:MAG TPA: LacI family DNA-binding transcriptional regulator, partial [Longimicrobium sp.]|nr:LacI family DNA-binding transcriptional regulator [Longimicrobium sp.]